MPATGSPQVNVPLVVFFYQAWNTNVGLQASLIRTYGRILRRIYPSYFSLPSAEHRLQPTSSPHLMEVCTPGSFPLPGAKHKLQPTGGCDLNRSVTLLRVLLLFGVDASNLSMGCTPFQLLTKFITLLIG